MEIILSKLPKDVNSDSETFTVTPDISLNPTSGLVNTLVIVTGTGFDPDSNVIITFAGNPVTTIPATVTTHTSGDFSANFTVPNSTPGARIVSATDEGSNSNSTIFTVTAPMYTYHKSAAKHKPKQCQLDNKST